MATSDPEHDLRVLAALAQAQVRSGAKPLSLVDLASVETGSDALAARHVLQRFLLKGWIELERDAEASRRGAGHVTDAGLRIGLTVPNVTA